MTERIQRCRWAGDDPVYIQYHDREWGVPLHDDRGLFEMLCLEGAQAGLSWITILRKRDGYRRVFREFDPDFCSRMTDEYLQNALNEPGIVRNRLKVYSVRANAIAYMATTQEFGAFSTYIWSFVDHAPVINHWEAIEDVPATSAISDAMSKDLKKRGFKFTGSTICYAFMQACGLVNDHVTDCFRHKQLAPTM